MSKKNKQQERPVLKKRAQGLDHEEGSLHAQDETATLGVTRKMIRRGRRRRAA